MGKQYFDPETGELVSEDKITKEYFDRITRFRQPPWMKVNLRSMNMLKSTFERDSPRAAFFFWILGHIELGSNTFSGSQRWMAEKAGVSQATVQRALTMFQECDLICATDDGRWMVNPSLVHAGGGGKERWLYERYNGYRTQQYQSES